MVRPISLEFMIYPLESPCFLSFQARCTEKTAHYLQQQKMYFYLHTVLAFREYRSVQYSTMVGRILHIVVFFRYTVLQALEGGR